MESYSPQHHFHLHQQHQKQQMNSGLTRYQSAPSSYFSRESIEEFLDRPTSPETEKILSGILQTTETSKNVDSFLHHSFSRKNNTEGSSSSEIIKLPDVKTEAEETALRPGESIGYDSASRSLNPNKRQRNNDDLNQSSNLARHNSSPAGLFSSIDVETACAAVMKSMGDFGAVNVMKTNNTETSPVTPKSKPLSSRPASSISETDVKPGFSSRLPPRTLSGSQHKSLGNHGSGSGRPPLAHHVNVSLPKSLSDIEEMLSDSIPCKIRAKRGCATHPRSVAERVRRTKISERMKKLQDLVPNMNTQTNTADMLESAVEYIRDLQEQVKILEERRGRCSCPPAPAEYDG